MPTETETTPLPMSAVNGYMASFNRYGLPGVVIGAQFFIIVVMLYFVLTTFQANIKAMTEMTAALGQLTSTIRER